MVVAICHAFITIRLIVGCVLLFRTETCLPMPSHRLDCKSTIAASSVCEVYGPCREIELLDALKKMVRPLSIYYFLRLSQK